MKTLRIYSALGLRDDNQVFDFLSDSFRDVVRTWDYFVNWDKVLRNTDSLSSSIEKLESLIGSKDFDKDFLELVRTDSTVLLAIPALLVRDGAKSSQFEVLSNIKASSAVERFDFNLKQPTNLEVEKILRFIRQSGLIQIFSGFGVKSLRDYLLGVEAGIDSNGRKNRSGFAMESLIEAEISSMVDKHKGWQYMKQATEAKISDLWGVKASGPKSTRRSDFALLAEDKLTLIEVNIYSGGGSKLKAVAGEFITLAQQLRDKSIKLVWITDGLGWKTALRPLKNAFDEMDFIFNFELLQLGALEEAIAANN